MQERHDILERTIGYFDEEQEALDTGYWLMCVSFVALTVGSILQFIFFHLYNGICHPFANILLDPEPLDIEDESGDSSIDEKNYENIVLETNPNELEQSTSC